MIFHPGICESAVLSQRLVSIGTGEGGVLAVSARLKPAWNRAVAALFSFFLLNLIYIPLVLAGSLGLSAMGGVSGYLLGTNTPK
jgi:hypothetical protein